MSYVKPVRTGLIEFDGLFKFGTETKEIIEVEVFDVPFDLVKFRSSGSPYMRQRGTYEDNPDFEYVACHFDNPTKEFLPAKDYYVSTGVMHHTLEDMYSFYERHFNAKPVFEIWSDNKE